MTEHPGAERSASLRATLGRWSERAGEYLALRRNTVILLFMVVCLGIGERLAERFMPLYLLALGGGAGAIGVFSGAVNLVNAMMSYFGGLFSDRAGHKKALLVFTISALCGYCVVILFPAWQVVIPASLLFLTWSSIAMPATLDLTARSVPAEKRTMGISMNSLIRRIPMILGPLLGGLLIGQFGEADGMRAAFAGAVVFAVLSLLAQQRLIPHATSSRRERWQSPLMLWREMQPALRHLLLSDMLVRFCEQIPYAFVIVWCVKIVGVSPLEFGVLTTVEMVTALLLYVPVAHFADKTTKKPFIVATFGFFTLFPLVLWFSRSFLWLVIAFIVRGLKEFGEPTRKGEILALSPEGKKAGMFGFYYLLRDSVVAIAATAGAALWVVSPALNLMVSFGFGLLATLLYGLRSQPVRVAEDR